MMKNGNNINQGQFHRDYCAPDNSYISGHASTMIIPDPYTKEEYYLIHQTVEQLWPDEYSRVYYSKIDMSKEGGLGEVVEKNKLILPDSTYLGEMAAVKHANGKDWWILMPEDSNNVYNFLVLDSFGIRKSHDQVMGPKVGYYGTGSGQCKFSPDGKKFARWTFTQQLFVADFDRQTGRFSNFQNIMVHDTVAWGGVEFSPNSRFLYVSSAYRIDQFDLWESDLAGSQITVAKYDGFVDVLPTEFRKMQLTPDCRIFINSPGGHRYWHIIEEPNEKGLACNLRQHSLLLPTRTFNTMPYFPNYNLGPVGQEGYPCDSTRITSSVFAPEIMDKNVWVFPNPASNLLTFQFSESLAKPTTVGLFNQLGEKVLEQPLIKGQREVTVPVSHLPTGLYFYSVMSEGMAIGAGKVVVQ